MEPKTVSGGEEATRARTNADEDEDEDEGEWGGHLRVMMLLGSGEWGRVTSSACASFDSAPPSAAASFSCSAASPAACLMRGQTVPPRCLGPCFGGAVYIFCVDCEFSLAGAARQRLDRLPDATAR